MKGFVYVTAVVLIAIGIGVSIVASVGSIAVASPTGVALAYVADFKSGNCIAAKALFVKSPERWGCTRESSIASPIATSSPLADATCRGFGCERAFGVTVTFESHDVGWTGYAARPPIHLPATIRWKFLVGQMPSGQFKLLPVFPK